MDAFLEHRLDRLNVGKAAIATVLIPYENPEKLFSFERNWLRYVFANLNAKFEDFEQNKLSIITYNYDRTVEHFVFTALKHCYSQSDDACCAILEKMPIIHLHGRLGYLPWQSTNSRPFETNLQPQHVKLAADSIKIIHEDITDGRDTDFKKAKALLATAERVIIMGFGYDPINMQSLGIGNSIKCKVLGSCLGMSEQEKRWVAQRTDKKVQLRDGDCFDMAREHIVWI